MGIKLPQPTPEKLAAAISKHLIPALQKQPLTPAEIEKKEGGKTA
jgi:hypothetical protein